MPINDLEQKLQKGDSDVVERGHNKTVYNVWESVDEERDERKAKKKWTKKDDPKIAGVRMRAIVIGVIAIIALSVLMFGVFAFVQYQKGFFSSDRVIVNAQAPAEIKSNVTTEIVFEYTNDNRAQLNNSQIVVQFGEYFVPEKNQNGFKQVSERQGVFDIGTIKGGTTSSVTLMGHFVGPEGEVDSISGTLKYIPEKTSTQYTTKTQATVRIISSPLSLEIISPQEVVSGNLMNVRVFVKNNSNETMNNLKLNITLPKQFSMYNAQPKANRGTVWFIDEILPNEEKVVQILGGIDAEVNTTHPFIAELGSMEDSQEYVMYAKAKYAPVIINSPIIVHQEVFGLKDGIAYAGDVLKYYISFENNGDIPLRDIILSTTFDTEVLDFATLDLIGGKFDSERKRITWKASDVSELKLLKPGESGRVEFDVSVVEAFSIQKDTDYNFSVTTVASIDSEDISDELRENKTVLSNVTTVPIGAKVIVESTSEYKSGAQPIENGQETIYTISMKVESINNDLADARLIADLPTYVKFIPGQKDLKYNERTNSIEWEIGNVKHGTGVLTKAKEIQFDVSVTPSINQISDRKLALVTNQKFTAIDKFTEHNIEYNLNDLFVEIK